VARSNFESVAAYIASQPEDTRPVLRRVRDAIREAVPALEESISYQMPTYKLPGGAVLYFAGWRRHVSLYPATAGVVKAFKDELEPYEVEKGTIRFPLARPMPVKLIARIAKFRAKETAGRAETKTRTKPKTKRRS
jgi:uncharacterized protein YdhG (YjbR/CyaY superfamily)